MITLSLLTQTGANMRSNVQKLMEKKGFTIKSLEASTGVSHVTIIRARSSIKGCRLETLVKIADALGCLVDDLFDK
jgi:DNA-binding Xre family transcriptional regulator